MIARDNGGRLVRVKDLATAPELYQSCIKGYHRACPVSRPNVVPMEGRCDCLCHDWTMVPVP